MCQNIDDIVITYDEIVDSVEIVLLISFNDQNATYKIDYYILHTILSVTILLSKIVIYYFYSDDMININDFNPKDIKVDKKLYKDILIYYIWNETLDGLKSLYINCNKINGYIEDKNGSKYLTLTPVDENKDKIKKCKGTWEQKLLLENYWIIIELENN